MQNLCSNLTIICCQTPSIPISHSSKMYTYTTLNKNSAMNIFNFVFSLDREEKFYIISVYKCGRMSRRNFATVHFQRLKNISHPIFSLFIIQTNKSCFFCYSKFDYYRPCVILTHFFLHMTETCLFIYLFLNIDKGLFLFRIDDKYNKTF